jgi:chemotaxis protein MotA
VISVIGILVVIAAVIGGYLMEHGKLLLLNQPAEFVIIGGAAFGSLIVANPMSTVKLMVKQLAGITKSGPNSQDYMDLLLMLYELLNLTRREGLLALEGHVEKPEDSEIFKRYPSFTKNHHAVAFLCDTLRLILTDPDIQAHDLDALMEQDMETHHAEQLKPSQALAVVGDALPGLGIVAAVLGVVLTMQAISGPVEVIGEKVGAALVGTFLGVLLSYGFVQPLCGNMANKVNSESQYYVALKQVLLAFRKGSAPAVAVEFARRSIGNDVRPGFTELNEAFRAAKSGGAAKK